MGQGADLCARPPQPHPIAIVIQGPKPEPEPGEPEPEPGAGACCHWRSSRLTPTLTLTLILTLTLTRFVLPLAQLDGLEAFYRTALQFEPRFFYHDDVWLSIWLQVNWLRVGRLEYRPM